SLRGILPFRRNQPYSEDAIDRAAAAIVTNLQERGFYNATVDTEESLQGNVWTSTFHVNPGQQFRLEAVTFTGNEKVSDKTLQGVVATSPRGGIKGLLATILRRPQGVTREQIAADRATLESYYRLHGFLTAAVATPVVNTNAATGVMTIDFPITEGPETMVASVAIEGNEQVATKDLPKPTLKVGGALNPTLERDDVIALQTFYSDRGNAEVQVHVREEVSADKTSARAAYTIAEGKDLTIAGALGGTAPLTSNTGINRVSPLVSASIAHRNLFGTGRYLGLELIYARPNRQDAYLTYREPFIGRFDLPIQVTAF